LKKEVEKKGAFRKCKTSIKKKKSRDAGSKLDKGREKEWEVRKFP